MFDRIHLWSHLVLDLYLLEEIFKTTVSVLMIGIHIFYFFLVAPLCWALLWAPKAPLLSQLISLPGMELPQVQEPRLTFSSLPRVQVLSCFLSSSFSLLWLQGGLSYPFRCLRSSASVQQVVHENCCRERWFYILLLPCLLPLFSFALTGYVEVILAFQKSEVFYQCSVDVLCESFHS